MKKLTGWLALGVVVAIAAAQGNGKDIVQSFVKTVNGAESLSVNYTAQMVGMGSREFTLDLAKPNKARIETDTHLIVADGTTITKYDKAAKSYFKSAQTQADLNEIFQDEDLAIWNAFFNPGAMSKIASAKALPNKTIAGQSFKVVEVAMDAQGKLTRTLYIDSNNLVRRSQTLMKGAGADMTTVYIAKNLQTSGVGADKFAFKAPDGSREVTLEEMMSATWYHDLEEAKRVAAKTNRKIFVDFMATWCGPCKMLDKEVLQTEDFKKMSKKFVFLKIDVDAQKEVAQAYSIEAMPTQMVLASDGSVVGKTVGYGGAAAFYGWLNQYL